MFYVAGCNLKNRNISGQIRDSNKRRVLTVQSDAQSLDKVPGNVGPGLLWYGERMQQPGRTLMGELGLGTNCPPPNGKKDGLEGSHQEPAPPPALACPTVDALYQSHSSKITGRRQDGVEEVLRMSCGSN